MVHSTGAAARTMKPTPTISGTAASARSSPNRWTMRAVANSCRPTVSTFVTRSIPANTLVRSPLPAKASETMVAWEK